jgi:molecular chaperone GrpE
MTKKDIPEEQQEKPNEQASPAVCVEPTTKIPSEADQLKQQLIEAEDKYLRLYAEFDNFRRRTDNEKSELCKTASKSLIESILPILDSFCHSEGSFDKETTSIDDLKKGFSLIHKQLEDALKKHGVEKMVTVGKVFDPYCHEAVMQKESDQPSLTILEELQVGYLLHDKVLRPAIVVVAK